MTRMAHLSLLKTPLKGIETFVGIMLHQETIGRVIDEVLQVTERLLGHRCIISEDVEGGQCRKILVGKYELSEGGEQSRGRTAALSPSELPSELKMAMERRRM